MLDLQGYGHLLIDGTWVTIKLALTSLILGLLFGLLGAAAKLSSSKTLRFLAGCYTTLIRGIPELLLVLFIYFGGSILVGVIASNVFGYHEYIEIGPFIAGVAALSIAFGAFATEVFRGAFQAIPKGQWESGAAFGMTPLQTFFRIILPQVWRLAIPGLGNLFQVLLKDTALVSVAGLPELMNQASTATGSTNQPFTFYMAAAFIFLALTVAVTFLTTLLEKRTNRGYKEARS